jgi:hypothetical protein
MNCKKCGTQKELKPVQTCCEMTGTWITVNIGYCSCDDKDDDGLSGRMIDHGERPTITINPKDSTPGLLRKVQGLKTLQRVGKSIGIKNTVNVEVKEINVSERVDKDWFM